MDYGIVYDKLGTAYMIMSLLFVSNRFFFRNKYINTEFQSSNQKSIKIKSSWKNYLNQL
jgi:hypothetical protein